jgi:MraZ protein
MGNSVKIDEKGRLKIPADLLPVLQDSDTEFYVTSEEGDSIRIYPMKVWSQMEARLRRLCLRNRKYRNVLTRAKYFGQTVTIDTQGRFLIPIALRRSAQIKGTVDILDYSSYLEVWNHARFLRNLVGHPITTQDENMLSKLSSSAPITLPAARKRVHDRAVREGAASAADRLPRRRSQTSAIRAISENQPDIAKRARVA